MIHEPGAGTPCEKAYRYVSGTSPRRRRQTQWCGNDECQPDEKAHGTDHIRTLDELGNLASAIHIDRCGGGSSSACSISQEQSSRGDLLAGTISENESPPAGNVYQGLGLCLERALPSVKETAEERMERRKRELTEEFDRLAGRVL